MTEAALSEASLEALCMAILALRDEDGRVVQLHPKDVLQPWIMDKLPEVLQ